MSGYFGNCAERKIVSAGFRLQFLRNIDSFYRQLLVAAPYFIANTLDISYLTAKGGDQLYGGGMDLFSIYAKSRPGAIKTFSSSSKKWESRA